MTGVDASDLPAGTGWWGRAWHRVRVWAGFAVFWTGSVIPHRVRFARSAYLPPAGPALLVPNHLAVTDPLAVARTTIGHRRFPHFLILAPLFRVPVLGHLGRAMKQIPVARGSTEAARSLIAAGKELQAGHVVVIYPEGRISRAPDQRPGTGHSGAARLALRFPDVPVLPVGQWGAGPGWRRAIRRQRVDVRIGPPVDLSPWRGRTDREAVAEATAAIMAAIRHQVELVRGAPFDGPAG